MLVVFKEVRNWDSSRVVPEESYEADKITVEYDMAGNAYCRVWKNNETVCNKPMKRVKEILSLCSSTG